MTSANKKKNNLWLKRDAKFSAFERSMSAPSFDLKNVPYVNIKKASDLENIPNKGGCYWIWTNEKIVHTLHTRELPKKFDGGEIIYNGIAKDNIQGRIKNHLFSDPQASWSGISVDILKNTAKSHRKKAMSKRRSEKIAYHKNQKICDKNQLLRLSLSKEERAYVKKTNTSVFYFRNGINIEEDKHKKNKFRVYFIVEIESAGFLAFIEKTWRDKGLPRLCSYISGR